MKKMNIFSASRALSYTGVALFFVSFAASSGQALPIGNGNISASEISNMQMLYELPIDGGTINDYSINNSSTISAGSYSRIGYYFEITSGTQAGEWVYVSMDQFESNPANLAVGNVHTDIVNNATVFASSGSGIMSTGSGISTVNLEMWNTNYSWDSAYSIPGASSDAYDFGDNNNNHGSNYGSFQIHNYGDQQTLFAYNHYNFGPGEGGIGNNPNPNGHPDWTFSGNNIQGTLQILVGEQTSSVPELSSTFTLIALGLLPLALVNLYRRKQ